MTDITFTEGKSDQEHSRNPEFVVYKQSSIQHHSPTTAPDLDPTTHIPKYPVPESGDSDLGEKNRYFIPLKPHTNQTHIDPPNNTEQTAVKHSGIRKILCFAITCTCTCLIIFAAAVVIIPISFLKKTPNEVCKEIGDISGNITSDLVSLGSGGNINITLEEDGDVIVYITESIPAKKSDTLEEVAITPLLGKARQNYNYYGNNQPIYLIENSVLTYELLIVHGPRLHSCPAQLFFFDNYDSYNSFRNYDSYETIASSPCFDFSDTWSLNITKSSIVYAAIAIEDNVTVTGNVSVTRVRFYYNTTNLAKYPLKGHNSTCVINTEICSTKYALIAASNMVKVKYKINSNWPCGVPITLIIVLLLILVTLIFCVVAAWYRYNKKRVRSKTTGSTEPSEPNEVTPLKRQ